MERITLSYMRESRLPYMAEVAKAAGVDMTGWTFGQHFGLMWTLVDAGMNRYGTWATLAEADRGTDAMIRAWQAVTAAQGRVRDGWITIVVTGYHALNNSTSGNPRFMLTTDKGTFATSSDAACSYGIRNGWTVNNRTKDKRIAYVKLTRAGRIAELEWADGNR